MNMKKNLICIACFVVLSSVLVSGVSALTFSPWVGYGPAGLKEVNDYITARSNSYNAGGSTCTLVTVKEFYSVGFDVGMFRIEYVMPAAMPKIQEATALGTITYDFSTSLATALVGFRILNPAKSVINLGVYIGYGGAMTALGTTLPDGTSITPVVYTGTGLVEEAVLSLKSGPLEINAGMRQARIPQLAAAGDYPLNIPKVVTGDVLYDDTLSPPAPLVFDYSGMFVTVGLRFGGGGYSQNAPAPMPPPGFKY